MKTKTDVESFYHLSGVDLANAECQGLACFVTRDSTKGCRLQPRGNSPRVYCLGKCFAAPASGGTTSRPIIEIHSRRPVVLERIADGGAVTLNAYLARGGLAALRQALSMSPDRIIAEIEASHLRGRGGAGFATGTKWRSVAAQSSPTKYIVANLDEGDPGAYIDRFIAELDPFNLLEGMAIAAHAVGASKGWIYVRCEYPAAIATLREALTAAQSTASNRGFLGTELPFDVELVIGQGSYLCGEETALLNSIEHQRPVARVRPPYVSDRGLNGLPTLVNNVETIANVPWIIRNGADGYAGMGFSSSRGTKVVSLNSLFRRPGLYEVEFGIPLRQIVYEFGGGLRSGAISGLLIGGPLAGVVPPKLFDTPFGFEELRAIGASLGHGGIVAFDEHTSIAQLVQHVFSFGAYESCGKCTPCRLGCSAIEQIFDVVGRRGIATAVQQQEYRQIVDALDLTSLCGFGTGLAEFARSIERYYARELKSCFT
jgi:NADH:ubiquinone oxidoreductase subunit F (NADH-binding)